ncbi:hypothetical protein J1614_011578 [Plenodomus biglobosus]|nr:hypothetical protein J1614_011578 [Plenodomus biglobosus]
MLNNSTSPFNGTATVSISPHRLAILRPLLLSILHHHAGRFSATVRALIAVHTKNDVAALRSGKRHSLGVYPRGEKLRGVPSRTGARDEQFAGLSQEHVVMSRHAVNFAVTIVNKMV